MTGETCEHLWSPPAATGRYCMLCDAPMIGEKDVDSHEPAIGETQPTLRSTAATQAPAEMPGVEEIARAIYERRNGHGCKPWSLLTKAHKEPYLGDAEAAQALFAPILAEKEQVSALMCDDCGWAMRFPDLGCVHCGFHRAEARALAAEAALAAERERCAKIADDNADNDSRGDSPYDNGAGSCGYRKACYDIAAAIRAEGE